MLNWESLLHASILSEFFPSSLPCRIQADPSALHLLLKTCSSFTVGFLGIPHEMISLSLRETLLHVKKVAVHLTCWFEGQFGILPMASHLTPTPSGVPLPAPLGSPSLLDYARFHLSFPKPYPFIWRSKKKLCCRNFPPASEHRNTIYTKLLLQVVLPVHSATSNLLAEQRATEKRS